MISIRLCVLYTVYLFMRRCDCVQSNVSNRLTRSATTHQNAERREYILRLTVYTCGCHRIGKYQRIHLDPIVDFCIYRLLVWVFNYRSLGSYDIFMRICIPSATCDVRCRICTVSKTKRSPSFLARCLFPVSSLSHTSTATFASTAIKMCAGY